MSQRTSAAVALGGLAGLAYLSSGSQTFAAAPATANLRHQRTAQTAPGAFFLGFDISASNDRWRCGSRRCGCLWTRYPLAWQRAVRKSVTARKALDQSSRYADLSLDEATLIKNGKHVLVAYIMKPKVRNQHFWAGCPYKSLVCRLPLRDG